MVKNKYNLSGFILLNKAKDITSNRALMQLKHLFNAAKAGHTGALDPLATGMLPICFGEATKFSQYLLESDKNYSVCAHLGVRTDSSDSDGNIIEQHPIECSLPQILVAVAGFKGKQQQIPTMFSALKHNGKPLYEYARQGITIERDARDIEIYAIDFISYEEPFLRLNISCSKGTYIRTIIDDLGQKLGCGAHVCELHRTKVAGFESSEMLDFEQISQLVSNIDQNLADDIKISKLQKLLRPAQGLINLPSITVTDSVAARLRVGQRINLTNDLELLQNFVKNKFKLRENETKKEFKIFDSNQSLVGVCSIASDLILRPERLISN